MPAIVSLQASSTREVLQAAGRMWGSGFGISRLGFKDHPACWTVWDLPLLLTFENLKRASPPAKPNTKTLI